MSAPKPLSGPECQTKDWKKHKYNCSLLPDGPLLPAHIAPNVEIDLLVRQAGEMIRAVLVDWKERGLDDIDFAPATAEEIKMRQDTDTAKDFIELKSRAEFELPEEYTYIPIQSDMNPVHRILLSLSRLYFIHEMSYCSDEDQRRLVAQCASLQIPSSYPQLYGPKIVARPADLSDGEYDMLLSTMPMYFVGDEERLSRGEETWFPLCAVSKGLRG
ncbi:hypothetical protein HWV62_13555 [Athelia sp. TMB]|nr:hypothetical protein HWV62_13555 [Athelia sp. TMB]